MAYGMDYGWQDAHMPKIARELTPVQLARLKDEGSYAVGGVPGLLLRVEGGSRGWVLRFVAAGKRRRMGLGSVQDVSLAQARELARAARAAIRAGQDPIDARRAGHRSARLAKAKALTFRRAAELYIAAKEREWKNPKHRQQWVNTLATYADPVIGALDVSEVDTDHVLQVLQPIWVDKTETASRLRGRLEQILNWATVRGSRAGDNPARWRGHMDQLLPLPSRIARVRHHPALPIADAPGMAARINAAPGQGAQALLLQILTACRSGEVRGARWSEIDLDGALWIIPAERMKARREHRVPLSRQALALLRAQPVVAGCDLVFPARGNLDRPLSDMALAAVLRRMGAPCVPHGFRSTFRDWAAETTEHNDKVAEAALAHTLGDKTQIAYQRGDLLAKRAALMQDWADYCLPPVASPTRRAARARNSTKPQRDRQSHP